MNEQKAERKVYQVIGIVYGFGFYNWIAANAI
jgi:hypothetical protein